ncbi:hypothetical protein HS125_12320 [bacterium]|nr:hypothetical protein [bacterium]
MNLAFSLSGTTVVLSTNQESFLIYCREHFGDACSATPVDAAEVEVEARFQPATAPPPLADYADWDACSRGFRARGDSLIWWPQRRCPHLELLSRWNGGRLTCRARLIAATPPQEEAALRRDARRRAAAYRPFTFFLFYFPVLWWQAVVLRRAPLHAAAAARQDRAVLFVGAAGCGKSTLALLLSSLPGWSLLSENLCLTDGAQLWACREPTVLKHPQLAEILARAPMLLLTRRPKAVRTSAFPKTNDALRRAPSALSFPCSPRARRRAGSPRTKRAADWRFL